MNEIFPYSMLSVKIGIDTYSDRGPDRRPAQVNLKLQSKSPERDDLISFAKL